jgi:hypothetical protein
VLLSGWRGIGEVNDFRAQVISVELLEYDATRRNNGQQYQKASPHVGLP